MLFTSLWSLQCLQSISNWLVIDRRVDLTETCTLRGSPVELVSAQLGERPHLPIMERHNNTYLFIYLFIISYQLFIFIFIYLLVTIGYQAHYFTQQASKDSTTCSENYYRLHVCNTDSKNVPNNYYLLFYLYIYFLVTNYLYSLYRL